MFFQALPHIITQMPLICLFSHLNKKSGLVYCYNMSKSNINSFILKMNQTRCLIKPQLHIHDSGYKSPRLVRIKSGCMEMDTTETFRSHEFNVINDCATTMLVRQRHDITVEQSYCVGDESGRGDESWYQLIS